MKHLTQILCFLFLGLSLAAQNVNLDFESSPAGTYTAGNSVSGWSLSSQSTVSSCTGSWTSGGDEFSIESTPILTYSIIGAIPSSPLGGNKVAVLNDLMPDQTMTRLSRTYTVSWYNSVLAVAYAGVWTDCGAGQCCEHAGFKMLVSDQSGTVSCKSYTMSANTNCRWPAVTYSTSPWGSQTATWTNWKVMYLDLTPYIGTVVNLEFITKDCNYGAHVGSLIFDIKEAGLVICETCDPGSPGPVPTLVNFCGGTSNATIDGPLGYSTYSWTAPAGYPISTSQSTLSSLTLTNAVAGSVYTLATTQYWSQCTYVGTYTLATGNVTTTSIGSSPTCSMGASGSATVVGSGSGTGYVYSWTNATNSVVSTGSFAANLPAGIYTVNVSAIGSASSTCGNTTRTVQVSVAPVFVPHILKPYCGNNVYLCGPGTGTNYQWYTGLTPVSPTVGGSAICYTAMVPSNGWNFNLGWTNPQGCRDSINYVAALVSPGTLSVISNPLICENASSGAVSLSLTAATGAQPGMNSFTVVSSSSVSPSYTSSGPGSPANIYTTTGLSAGLYSVTAFDGVCNYATSFSVSPFVFSYSVSPAGSPTICNGSFIAAGAVFSLNPSGSSYTYSWTPNYFLIGQGAQNVVISPSLSPGTQTTVTYSVVVTPTIVNCPQTKTISVTMVNPGTPTIATIPTICMGSSPYTINVNPPGGIFSGNVGVSSSGVIHPSIAPVGINTFTYTTPQIGTCAVGQNTGTFALNAIAFIGITGNNQICSGQTTTLSLAGGSTYSWSTGSTNSFIIVSPTISTSYSATIITGVCNGNSITKNVVVIPSPSPNISGPTSLCLGDTAILNASGAANYTWSAGSSNATIAITPNTNTTYTLLASNSPTCPSTSTVYQVQVIPKPTLSVSGNTSICEGQSTTLLASGANTYTWNNSVVNPVYSITPLSSTSYTVVGTDGLTFCSSKTVVAVHVTPLPVLNYVGDTIICNGENTSIYASGALSYSWSNGSASSSINISPSASTVYTVTGYAAPGSCTTSLSIPVIVNDCTVLSEIGSPEQVKIYPNPSVGQFFIEVNEPFELTIYDALGRKLFYEEKVNGNYVIDLRNYANGNYIVKLRSDNKNHYERLIKNN